jgi:DNA/RNA endonuclease G (NUC1)
MKIWKLAACLILMLMALSSCGESGSKDVLPEITIMQDEVRFESAGGSQTITLKANDSWSFAKGVAWVTLSQISGGATKDGVTLTLVAGLNTGYERQGEMTFKCGSRTASVKVYQAGAGSSSEEIIEPEADNWYIFRKAKAIQSGKSYLFFANNKIAVPHASTINYGYLKTTGVVDNNDHITTRGRNAFKITEEDGGYVIRQVSDDRVLYMMDNHNSFQVGTKPSTGHVWDVKLSSDGEFIFTNKEKNKIIQFDSSYGTYAAYPTVTGVYPCLYECISETVAPVDPTLKGMPKWLELPETKDDDGLDFYTHDQITDGKTIRSWSFDYDSKALLSHWIAYPLNKKLKGSGSRSDQWGLDPKVPASKQPVLYTTYKSNNGKKYDRGHQIPSADRLDYDANVKTFYFTNMTPQLSGLNQASWANLETRVREWSESFDTLYVVTGCSVKGSTEVAYDNDGKAVTVPTGYYKALLGYKKSGSVGNSSQNGGYIGCAFWFDHVDYADDFMEKAMSISELEEKTGVNFFVNLPAATDAAKAKAIEENRDSWWK